jgi:hypothetical protein
MEAMNPKRQAILQSVFNIQPGEGRQVAVMFLYSLYTVGGVYIIGRTEPGGDRAGA